MDALETEAFGRALGKYVCTDPSDIDAEMAALEDLKHWLRTNRDSIKTPAELSAITGQSDFT